MADKTAFVTGGTGFIGLNLIELLTQSGWDVTALHRPNSRLTYLRKYPVRLAEGTIEDAASIQRAMPEDVDTVFHVAGDVSLWSGYRERRRRHAQHGSDGVGQAKSKVRSYVFDRCLWDSNGNFRRDLPKARKK